VHGERMMPITAEKMESGSSETAAGAGEAESSPEGTLPGGQPGGCQREMQAACTGEHENSAAVFQERRGRVDGGLIGWRGRERGGVRRGE
jgi:hypothetical protein